MTQVQQAVAVGFALANVAAFAAYHADKRRARRNERRIAEATLLVWGAAGPAGAWLAVALLRHKTRKPWFLTRLALASVVTPPLLWAMLA